MNKTCFKCHEEKPLSEFYRHSAMSDGHLGKCKSCTRADALAHRANKLEAIRQYDRSRGKLAHRKSASTAYTRRFRSAFPDRARAHRFVSYAIRTGKLHRAPCVVCGHEKAEAHHADYSKPLEVVWLCKPHHFIADAERRKTAA